MSGAASRNRGLVTEQMEVRWFRANGFPGAERTVRTGYRTAGHQLADAGDIGLCPGVIVASKALRPVNRAERAVHGWLAETEAQRAAARADVALLVVRRDGTADVGEWFCWLRVNSLTLPRGLGALTLYAGHDAAPVPVRLLVADACRLLRAVGYGEPLLAEIVDLPSAEDVRGTLRPEWVRP